MIKEIEFETKKINKKDKIIKDCIGQNYFWEDLNLGRVKIY